jgi:hypothetical protein
MHLRRLGACIAVLGLAAPAPAHAAKAEVEREISQQHRFSSIYSEMHYRAAGGERNEVSLSSDGGGILVHDQGAAIEAGRSCTSVDMHTVRCVHEPDSVSSIVYLDLGDLDDRSDTPLGFAAIVDAGPGDDVLHGSRLSGGDGDDVLAGTDSADFLGGGAGDDTLSAGPGDDTVGGGPGTDALMAGEGTDLITYEGRSERLTVDLADPGPDGAASENDSISDAENLTGGNASDVLRGTDGPNKIDGGGVSNRNGDVISGRGGDDDLTGTKAVDRISGGDGDDKIWGVRGPDRLSGGAGDDHFDLYVQERPRANRIACGSGRDTAFEPNPLDVVDSACENVTISFHTIVALPAGRRDAITFRFVRDRPPDAGFIRCGLIELGSPAGTLGRARFRAPKRGTKYVRVPLTPRGVRANRPGARIPMRFTVLERCPGRVPQDRLAVGGYTLRR